MVRWFRKESTDKCSYFFSQRQFTWISKQFNLNAINKFAREISGNRATRAGKRFTLFISNEDINDIIKIVKSLEDSGVLIDGVTETVKHEIKKQEDGFLGALLAPLATSFVRPVLSLVLKGISRRGVRRAGKGYMNKIF